VRRGALVDEVETTLRRLNEATFQAEARQAIDGVPWDEFLRSVLAEGFVLRRSRIDAEDENSDDMIRRISSGQSVQRRLLEETVRVWASDSLGAVKSVITLPSETGEDAYQNIKVFARTAAGWRCAYWQVTARPPVQNTT
jgi:hypothetical protein